MEGPAQGDRHPGQGWFLDLTTLIHFPFTSLCYRTPVQPLWPLEGESKVQLDIYLWLVRMSQTSSVGSLPRYPTDPQPALPPTSPPRRSRSSSFSGQNRQSNISSRSRSSSDERKGRPPGAPSLLYELRFSRRIFQRVIIYISIADMTTRSSI